MLRLILMRHAKSDWSHAGLSDHDRPLNKRGTASADALGHWLRSRELQPGEVLCSSAERTRQTLGRLGLPSQTPTRFTRTLYLAEADEMLAELKSAAAPTVLMVGHNHGIADMAHQLVKTPPDHERFDDYPTGSTLVCDFNAGSWNEIGWHQGQPTDFVIPRELS
ncbi:histidine phosphatase family protein [uncultured Roseobacter sp.]|uniref:SixA phosphatase family protein n=1 Tax=uncultured Roseobacter sp. TaxID=114847 RepID=UPI0026234DE9|nr:histidine phosphatase family protein [uncultured Roseobacter sp.]